MDHGCCRVYFPCRSTSAALLAVVPLIAPLLSSPSLRADEPADPIEWTRPAARPEFRRLLSAEEYQQRMDVAWSQIGSLDDLEASNMPVAGIRIFIVAPDSQAQDLGTRVGDRITHCNGAVLWKSDQLSFEDEAERELRLVGPDGDVRTVTVEPGRIGIDSRDFWHPELQYLRSGSRDAAWDRDVVTGLTMSARDPELAETCWARAVEAGYPRDDFSAASGAVIAMNSGRVEAAPDFAFACLNDEGALGETVHPHLVYRVALANYKLRQARAVVQSGPAHFDPATARLLQGLIDLHEGRTEQQRCVPPPSQLAGQMYADDFRTRAVAMSEEEATLNHIARLKASPQISLHSATAHYALASFSAPLPARNVDLQVRFRLRRWDDEYSGFHKVFECRLSDMEHWRDPARQRRGSETLLFAGILDDGTLRLSSGGLPVREFIRFAVDDGWEQEQSVRLIRVGGQAELFVNGTRVIYVPMYDDVNFVSVSLKSVGMEVEIEDLKVAELIERL